MVDIRPAAHAMILEVVLDTRVPPAKVFDIGSAFRVKIEIILMITSSNFLNLTNDRPILGQILMQ